MFIIFYQYYYVNNRVGKRKKETIEKGLHKGKHDGKLEGKPEDANVMISKGMNSSLIF